MYLWERCPPQLPRKSSVAFYYLIVKPSGKILFHLYVLFMSQIFNMKAKINKVKTKGKLYNATQLMIPWKFVIWEFTWTRLSWALKMAIWCCFWLQVKVYSSIHLLLFHTMGIWQSGTLNRHITGPLNQVLNVKAISVWIDRVSKENVLISTL